MTILFGPDERDEKVVLNVVTKHEKGDIYKAEYDGIVHRTKLLEEQKLDLIILVQLRSPCRAC